MERPSRVNDTLKEDESRNNESHFAYEPETLRERYGHDDISIYTVAITSRRVSTPNGDD
jgi:hypothetical protein